MPTPKFANILGTGFPDYVQAQIDQRKEVVKKQKRTPQNLQWLSNRTGWYRMSSGALVGGSDSLAKNNVLQGGLIKTKDGTQSTLKGGFSETYVNRYNDDLGYLPMPGITGLSITTGGKWQTLLEGEVEFIAYNLDQLNVLSQLYMSLGVYVFVEWGHTPYLDNNGSLQKNIRPINFFEYTNKDTVLQKVSAQKEETGGNYEALLGVVSNFSYNANSDGSYNCRIRVLGPGAIAESFRINTSTGKGLINKKETESQDYTSDFENALLAIKNQLLNGRYSEITTTDTPNGKKVKGEVGIVSYENNNFQKIITFSNVKTVEIGTTRTGEVVTDQKADFKKDSYANILNKVYSLGNYKGPNFTSNGVTFPNDVNNFQKYGNAHQIISNINNVGIEEHGLTPLKNSFFNGYTIDEKENFIYDWVSQEDKMAYITLGHLMCLVQHLGIFVTTSGDPQPALYIDYHPDNTIVKTADLQATLDPAVCIIPIKVNNKRDFSKFFGPLSTSKEAIYPQNEGITEPTYTNATINSIVNTDQNQINKFLQNSDIPQFDDPESGGGKLFNILINLNFAIDCVKKLAKTKDNREVYVLEYMNEILNGVNIALGKVNNFRASYVDCAHTIRIVDENGILPNKKSPSGDEFNFIKLPVFGLNSIAYDYSYSTKIHPKIMAQIVAAAQGLDAGVKDFSSKVLEFNHLNGGVIDRFKKEIEPAISPKLNEPDDNIINLRGHEKLFKHLMKIYSLEFGEDKPGTSYNLSFLYGDLQTLNTHYNPSKNDSILLPLEYTITMDGLSGILPYNAFLIPENRLPFRYRGRVMFIVYSINHIFESNQWKTQLRGLTYFRPNSDAPIDDRTFSSIDRDAVPIPFIPGGGEINLTYQGKQIPQFTTTSQIPQPDPKGEPLPEEEEQTPDEPIIEAPLDARPNPIFIPPNDIIGSMELIRTHEPKIPGIPELTAYRDRDYTKENTKYTYRIGYGSDTITTTTGKVRRVKKGDKITKAEAEADLRRRVDNIRKTIIQRCNDVGLNYENITDFRVQVVFIDCAYNYGTLWYDIINSYKNGGKEGLIQELERRIARGASQVPSRRQAEINYLRG